MKKVLFILSIVFFGIQANAQTDTAVVQKAITEKPVQVKIVYVQTAPQQPVYQQSQPQMVPQQGVAQKQLVQTSGVYISREQYEEYLYLKAKEQRSQYPPF